MKVAFQKWGNSLALRVPKVVAQEIGASDGKTAEMSVRDAKLVIEVTKPKRRKRRYTLDELVAGITSENRHEEMRVRSRAALVAILSRSPCQMMVSFAVWSWPTKRVAYLGKNAVCSQ
jgi:antitoxin MazE